VISTGSIVGSVVCCSRLTVDIRGFSLLVGFFNNLFFGIESRFFACGTGFDASNKLRKVS
jgi:hypothetical protein